MVRARRARGDGTCTGMRKDGVCVGSEEPLAAAELWNFRIVSVRPGQATVLVGIGERIVWLKLESRPRRVSCV